MKNIHSKKTVLITGATKGIGLATSQRLVKNDYQVIGIARNPSDSFPGTLFCCDLENIEQTASILEKIQLNSTIDAIVNNVGIVLPQPLGKIDLHSLQTVYDVNVRTAVQITQTFIESMKTKQWGRIINIASRAIFGVKERSSYAAAKSALVGLTKTWALELSEFGITVNAVAPGPIETELFRKANPIGSPSEKAILAKIAVGRMGQPSEIAAAIEFLLSTEAGFITGQVICIDGGASL